MDSVGKTLLDATVKAAEQNKPAILAALASQNVTIEAFVAQGIKVSVTNPVLGLILSELAPVVLKQLPSLEDAAFNALLALVKAEEAKL